MQGRREGWSALGSHEKPHLAARRIRMKVLLPIRIILIVLTILLSMSLILHAQDAATILCVVDGDTLSIEYRGKAESVRLIGIDAPESTMNRKAGKDAVRRGQDLLTIASMGIDAAEFVRRIVKKGDTVAVDFDVRTRTKDGMLLGYVYMPDGRMLNEEIVRAGYAYVARMPPNVKYQERFISAYKEAKTINVGCGSSKHLAGAMIVSSGNYVE
jgi:micrococcal nuclease